MDKDTIKTCMVGSYVYDVFKTKNNEHKITGDPDKFFYVLGWHIQQSYPKIYKKIRERLPI